MIGTIGCVALMKLVLLFCLFVYVHPNRQHIRPSQGMCAPSTVNDLINAHSQINASYLINAPPPPYAVKLVLNAPCLINAPLENCPQILGNGEIEQNQSIY